MKKGDLDLEDTLRLEYDLNSLRVRKLGSKRKSFSGFVIHLNPDAVQSFPSTGAVDEAPQS